MTVEPLRVWGHARAPLREHRLSIDGFTAKERWNFTPRYLGIDRQEGRR
jgi:hypothetical protein